MVSFAIFFATRLSSVTDYITKNNDIWAWTQEEFVWMDARRNNKIREYQFFVHRRVTCT